MMIFRTQLLLAGLLLCALGINAQQNISVQLTGNAMRHPLDLPSGVHTIQVCGLIPGNEYLMVANAAMKGMSCSLELSAGEQLLDNPAAAIQTIAQRPNQIQFTATESCAELILKAVSEAQGPMPLYLSIGCRTCPEDNTWKNNFWNAVEMVNLSTSGGVGAASLVNNTLVGGDCFDIANITSFGNTASRGTFTNGATNIGLNNGVVLCTGNVNILPGPNNLPNAGGGFGNNTPDDVDLATLTNGNQYDLSRIEFDFTPTASTVQFDFVFGSEEYCEYVGSNFNDVFGFFISGPGIGGTQNIALVPGTSTPVAINNVNHQTNTAYYVNNSTGASCNGMPAFNLAECQLDGWTTVLTATADVTPCSTYHIKLAIADIADALFASAVFLKANSFEAGGQAKVQTIYPAGQTYIYEDCGNNGFIRFVRGGGDPNVDLVINFTVSGTATPGTDYNTFTGPLVIPAGQTQIDIPITAFPDGIVEGDETIVVTLSNSCSCTAEEITFIIRDKPLLEVTMDDINLCGGSSATLSPSVTGFAPFTYLWSTGGTGSSITINSQGTSTYTVTVTDACGSTATAEATVSLQPVPTANLSGSGVFCAGTTTSINLTLTFTGVSPWELTYTANGNTVTETFTSSPATLVATDPGTYTLVSVSSSNGCTGTVSGNVQLNEITVNLTLTPTDPACFGSNNGSVGGSASGGSAPFNFSWNTGANTPNLNNLAPGTYSVTVTNGNGCTATDEVTLTQPPELTASINNFSNIDCNNPQGNADLEVSGGTPGYSFNWTGGSTLEDPVFTSGGVYTVTVTDDNNCTKTASVTITANTTLPTAVILPPAQVTCANPTLTLDASGSSQGPSFSYEWSGPSFVCCENTLQPQINEGGVYVLTITNADNGCTRTASVTVVQNNTPPVININTPPNIGCTMPGITINGNGSATGPGIGYQWTTVDGNITGGANTLNPQVNQAGTYTLVITNANNGCTNEESVTVTGNTIPPVAQINTPAIINCYSPEISIDASGSSQGGSFSYNWSGPPGGINGGGNTLNPDVDLAGTYVLTVTDTDNNCTATASVTVSADVNLPTAVIAPPQSLTCQNPELSLNGNGSSVGPAFTYEWDTPNGNILSGENTLTPVIDQPGTYTLIVTNTDNGCTRSATVTVNANIDFPVANAGPPRELNCLNATVQLSGSASTGPNFNFQWTASPGNFVSGQNTLSPTVNQPGYYTLLVTNTTNGCTAEDIVEVTENFDTPDAVIAPPQVLNCYNPSIELDATSSTSGPNITYQWTSTPPGGLVSGQGSPNPLIDQAGTYRLVVTNTESGCTDEATVQVTQDFSPPAANAGPTAQLSCQMPQVTLNGSGSLGSNFMYEWGTSPGNIVSGDNTLNPIVDEGGTYTLTVTNTDNGCTASSSVTITVNQNFPNAYAGGDQEQNCQNNGTLTLNGFGSSTGPSFTYQWVASPGNILSGANTLQPTINEEGFYTLIVTNTANGCTDEDEIWVVNNIIYPEPVIVPPQELNCNFPTVEIDAGNSSYNTGTATFSWTASGGGNIIAGSSSLNPEVNQPGIYNLLITNQDNFCTATASVTVTRNITPPAAIATVNGVLTCQFPQVDLNGNGSSTGPDFYYEWGTGNGNILSGELSLYPTVNQPGLYVLTVTNSNNGCTNTAAVTVTTSQAFPVANAGAPQDITCANLQLNLDGSGSSQGAQYAYVWSTPNGNILSGANTLTPTVNAPGVYDLSVVNLQNGCTKTASVVIGSNQIPPTIAVAPGSILSCAVPSMTLNGGGSSTGPNFSYAWTSANGNILSGQNTLTPTVNAIGDYTLVITNALNGCTASASTTVIADASVPTASAGPSNTLNCTVQSIQLNGNASSQGPQYSYQWSGPGIVSGSTELTPVVNLPGTYDLLVTNTGNGCTALSTVNIVQDIQLPIAEAGPTEQLDCTNLSQMLDGSSSSAGPNFIYQWTAISGGTVTGASSAQATVTQPGTYQLIVTNTVNGCTAADQVLITQDVVLPTAEAGPPGLITCTNPSVTLSGSGSTGAAFTYQWSTPNGNIAMGANSLSPIVDAPGDYNLLITNVNNGCTAIDQVAVAKDANVPTADVVVNGVLNCVTPQLQLDGTGSSQSPTITYTWSTGNGNIVSGGNTLTPVIDQPGQYILALFNTANNCQASFTANVDIDVTPPLANAGTPAVISCINPVLTLNGSGSSQGANFVYQWSTLNGNLLSGANTLNPQVDQSGFYSILVTNTDNGCTAGSTVQILLDQNTPEADAGPSPTLTCAVTTLTLNGTGSSNGSQFVYQWSTANGVIVSGGNTLIPLIAAPGDYQLLVSNAQNGCQSIDQVNVAQNIIPPTVDAGQSPTLTCVTTSLALSGSASAYNNAAMGYAWSTTDGQIISGANTLMPSIGDPGLYTLLVTDLENGCTQTDAVSVFENVVPPLSAAAVSGELTCTVTNLPLSGAGSSTGPQYSYNWNTQNGQILTGQTSLSPEVGKPGLYTLVVTDAVNGCTSTAAVTVTQNIVPPIANAGANDFLTCTILQTSLNGSATAGASGISYAWSGPGILGGGNTPTPLVNQTGLYTLQVTDLYNGCTDTDVVEISPDTNPPTALIATPDLLTCAITNVFLNGTGGSAGPQFAYQWTGPGIQAGANTTTPQVNQPGLYALLVTNSDNGCTATATVNVPQDIQAPLAEAGNGFELTCSVLSGNLSAAGSSAGTDFSYQWDTNTGNIVSGETSPTPVVNAPGLYNLLVTNLATGCTASDGVTVLENTNYPSDIVYASDPPACGGQAGSIDFQEISGGVGPYLYSIDGGQNFQTAELFGQLTPGAYDLVVQDVNGCEYEENLEFPVPVEPTVTIAPEIILQYGQSAVLTANLNIPLSQVDTIIWSPTDNLSFTDQPNVVQVRPFTNAVYEVLIINIDGYEDRAVVQIKVGEPNIWAPNVINPNGGNGNDRFLIFAGDRVVKNIRSLQVYDRWGTQVFLAQNIQPNERSMGWDGYFRDQPLTPAVFVWWAEVELASGETILMKGDVTVVR